MIQAALRISCSRFARTLCARHRDECYDLAFVSVSCHETDTRIKQTLTPNGSNSIRIALLIAVTAAFVALYVPINGLTSRLHASNTTLIDHHSLCCS
jgi:hypothetical protein